MAKGKKISEQPIVESLSGDELIPFAKNGANGALTPDTIKEFTNEGLENTYATIERVNDQLDGFAPKSWLASTDKEVSRINDALISGLNDKVDKDAVPTKVSELENDSEYQDKGHVSAAIKVAINAHETEVEERFSTIEDRIEGLDAHKVSKEDGKGLSSNDYTDEDKAKVDNLPDNTNFSLAAINSKVDALDVVVPNKADKTAVYSKTEANDTFVHQVEGKQLSTEDFTTLLKQKLDGLTNYDDTELTAQLNALKSRLDTILDSENTTAVIDTFQEIEAFLQGITNQQTLTGLLQEMKSEIVALCASTYLPLSGGIIDSGDKSNPIDIKSTADYGTLVRLFNKGTEKTSIGYLNNPDRGSVIYNAASNKYLGIKDDGTPHFNGTPLALAKGTSSQFLKADGSVDGTAYLPKSGGTITRNDKYPLTINSTSDTTDDVLLRVSLNDEIKSGYGWTALYGSYIYNYASAKHLGIKDDGTPHFQGSTLWHSGNDGSGSGLDADLLDGKHNGEVSALNLNVIGEITDANNVPSKNGIYRVATTNAVNFPSIEVYGVLVQISNQNEPTAGASSHYIKQILYRNDGGIIFREKISANDWSTWKNVAFTDSKVASANNLSVTLLTEGQDLNTLKTAGRYGTNSSAICASLINNPSTINHGEIFIEVYENARGSGFGVQFVFNKAGNSWEYWCRSFTSNGTFSAWKQFAFLDSNVASADKLTSKQLTNEDLNDIKDTNFSSYRATGGNTCTNKPIGVDGFELIVVGIYNNYLTQIIINAEGGIYRRALQNTTWLPWQQLATTDGAVAKLTTKRLTNEDLNEIKTDGMVYYGSGDNTCTNKPANVSWFSLIVLKSETLNRIQILNGIYRRIYDGYTNSWQPWRQFAFTDSNVASADKLTTKQLTNEDLNNIKDVNFSSYWASGENLCSNKPNGVDGFGLHSYRVANNWYVQILISSNVLNGNMYKRYCNASGTWSPWKKLLTEDDVTKIQSVASVPSTPAANTLYVIPE